MPKIVFTRIYHSLDEEYGHLSKFGCIEISNGICCLAAVTRENKYDTEIIDALPLALDNDELVRLLARKNPEYIGISACTMDIYRASDLAEKLKMAKASIVIIIGGPHITAVPDETMERFPAFDIGVIGEGEDTIIDLLNSLTGKNSKKLSEVEGLIFREGGRLITTRPRKFIQELDRLPLPAWDLLPDIKTYYFAPAWTMHSGKTATIVTSRGCPFQCIYCDRKVFGNLVRYHSAGYVLDMIRTLHSRYGISHFRIGDDNFIMNKERLFKICDWLIGERLKITWSCLARVDSIEPDVLAKMKKAGCWSIAFGVETGSQKIHDIEKKHVTLEKIEKAVALTRKAGIKTISFNIIGHPLETIDTIKETIRFNKKIKVDEFKTQFMVPFPGTELYKDAEKYGEFDGDWGKMAVFHEPIFIPNGLTKEEMIEWNKRGFREFYLQPRVILAYIKNVRSIAEFGTILTGAATILNWKLREITAFLKKSTQKMK